MSERHRPRSRRIPRRPLPPSSAGTDGEIILFGLVAAVVGTVAALSTGITLVYSYSDGDRIGYVQKVSHKGWVCRTREGELAMTPVPGAAPEIFRFSVRDEAVVKRIQAAEGRKVALHYKEKRGIPTTCLGETHYFINDVRSLAP